MCWNAIILLKGLFGQFQYSELMLELFLIAIIGSMGNISSASAMSIGMDESVAFS